MFINSALTHISPWPLVFLDFRRGLESHILIYLLFSSVHGDLISFENCSAFRINRIQTMGVLALCLRLFLTPCKASTGEVDFSGFCFRLFLLLLLLLICEQI